MEERADHQQENVMKSTYAEGATKIRIVWGKERDALSRVSEYEFATDEEAWAFFSGCRSCRWLE